jgi:plastocyanin
MGRMLRRAAPLAIAAVVLMQGAALAATDTVSMVGNSLSTFAFSPATLKAKLGDSVQWTNASPATSHTATNDTADPWTFNTGVLAAGATSATFAFTAAGSFAYHCAIHPTIMFGTVKVPMKAAPATGTLGTMFKITWASAAPPAGLVFDIQKKDPGGAFLPWQTGVTTLNVKFTPTATGKTQFRALVRNVASGAKSGFSATKTITVT